MRECTGPVRVGMRLLQSHDTQLHKKICSHTDFTICTVLNWLITATEYLGYSKPCNYLPNCLPPTFRQEKAIKKDIMTTAYHQWYHDVTTSYLLHHSESRGKMWAVLAWNNTNHIHIGNRSAYHQWYHDVTISYLLHHSESRGKMWAVLAWNNTNHILYLYLVHQHVAICEMIVEI